MKKFFLLATLAFLSAPQAVMAGHGLPCASTLWSKQEYIDAACDEKCAKAHKTRVKASCYAHDDSRRKEGFFGECQCSQ